MITKQKLLEIFQKTSLWIFVFQCGILVGIEAVYLAVFTQNNDFQKAYNYPNMSTIGLATGLYPIFAAIGAASVLYLVHLTSNVVILGISVFLWLLGYIIGTFLVGDMGALMAARVLKGFAIGLMTSVIPLYTEKAASSKRQSAQLLTLLQASVPLGILLMSLVAKLATPVNFHFRWIFTAIPALPIVLLIFYIPRGDRVINQIKEDKQTAKLAGKSAWYKTVRDIKTIGKSRYNCMRFVAACLAQCAGPLTAINVIFYYSTVMCQMLGFDPNEADYMSIGLYACNFVGTTLSLLFINRLPRLATLQYTTLGIGVLHFILLIVRLAQESFPHVASLGIAAITLLFAFVFLFSLMFASISLVYTSEVVPAKTRGVSIGLATASGWLCNFVITMVSSALLPLIGSYIFLIFGVICCLLFAVFSFMPQTIQFVPADPLEC